MAIEILIIDDRVTREGRERDRKDLLADCIRTALAAAWPSVSAIVTARHHVYPDGCDTNALPDTWEAAISDEQFANAIGPEATTKLLCIHGGNKVWAQQYAARALTRNLPVVEYSGGGVPTTDGLDSADGLHYYVRAEVHTGEELDFRTFFAHWGPHFAAGDVKVCWQYLEKSQGLQASPSRESEPRCSGLRDRVIKATKLYPFIRYFTHGAKNDIVNALLAPARMLREHCSRIVTTSERRQRSLAIPRDLIKKFNKKVRDEIVTKRNTYGELGAELIAAWEPINAVVERIDAALEEKDRILIASDLNRIPDGALDQCMELLTEIRILAGKKVQAEKRKSVDPVLPIVPTTLSGVSLPPFRVLVIDDNAAEWKPVIEVVSDGLERARLPAVFEFSTDGKFAKTVEDVVVGTGTTELGKVLADYDLVLLDVYLPDMDGLRLLKDIRERSMSLPVIVWTTSLDRDLAAEASLANGFLFKKTATCAEICDLLQTWLSSGRSQRLWSLPNPFFDHALRDPGLRKTALAFTKWTLRYMDCFHAVDHFFFRYFNDHGGRHILGVLDATAKLLRPFLFDSGPGALLSEDEHARNKQLFCLYIAVLCHEFGMFPIFKGEADLLPKPGTPISKAQWDLVDHFRALHAVRGMLMLVSDTGEAGERLDISACEHYLEQLDAIDVGDTETGGATRASVAVLVGYHQRCLTLKPSAADAYENEDIFARENGMVTQTPATFAEARKKVFDAEKDVASSGARPQWRDWSALVPAITAAWKESASVFPKQSLRQLCAILRLADAVDVDSTRLPAEFITNNRAIRRPFQEIEDVKRQVLADSSVERGKVSLDFRISQPTEAKAKFLLKYVDVERAAEIYLSSQEALALDYKEQKEHNKIVCSSDVAQDSLATRWWEWLADFCVDRSERPVKGIEAFLKRCLYVYFACSKYRPPSSVPPDQDEMAALATAAAVLVILEIESEYMSIVDVRLSDTIRLGDVRWAEDDSELPSMSILEW